MYAKVITEITAKAVDKTFTYKVPERLKKIKVGARVKIPFGKRELEGFVVELTTQKEDYELKEITSLVDEEPILTE